MSIHFTTYKGRPKHKFMKVRGVFFFSQDQGGESFETMKDKKTTREFMACLFGRVFVFGIG